MTRQTISFTDANIDWLKAQVEADEYNNESELINELIRKARKIEAQEYSESAEEIEWLSKRLVEAEKSGICEMTLEEIREEALKELMLSGEI